MRYKHVRCEIINCRDAGIKDCVRIVMKIEREKGHQFSVRAKKMFYLVKQKLIAAQRECHIITPPLFNRVLDQTIRRYIK